MKRRIPQMCDWCKVKPEAYLGWGLCIECEIIWEAQRRIRRGQQMIADGKRTIAENTKRLEELQGGTTKP